MHTYIHTCKSIHTHMCIDLGRAGCWAEPCQQLRGVRVNSHTYMHACVDRWIEMYFISCLWSVPYEIVNQKHLESGCCDEVSNPIYGTEYWDDDDVVIFTWKGAIEIALLGVLTVKFSPF